MKTSSEEILFYPSLHGATTAAPGKAGLVTEWKQQQLNGSGATTAETFAYTYDLAGRLKNSVRYLGTATSSNSKLTESNISYDLGGNLTALTRRDVNGSATATLSYAYNGPMRTTWTYDNHGNVTADPQSNISVAWNAIDLPRTLTSGSASTSRGYLSDGTLAQVSDGSTTRLYVGDMVFTRTGTSGTPTLESAAWEQAHLPRHGGRQGPLPNHVPPRQRPCGQRWLRDHPSALRLLSLRFSLPGLHKQQHDGQFHQMLPRRWQGNSGHWVYNVPAIIDACKTMSTYL